MIGLCCDSLSFSARLRDMGWGRYDVMCAAAGNVIFKKQ